MSLALPFFRYADPSARALRDDVSDWVSAQSLALKATAWRDRLPETKSLVFIYIPNTVDGVAALLGALSGEHAVAVLDPKLPLKAREALDDAYRPEVTIAAAPDDKGGVPAIRSRLAGSTINPANALLLSTSGSTGSPKFVRHTLSAIVANADAIATVLDVRANEVGCGHLPLHYSYGLSLLTSHMIRGAPVMLTELALTDRAFWPRVRREEIAHFPGVPFHFQTLQRLGFARLGLDRLRVLTQAGGALDVNSRRIAHDFMSARGGRFHVMYGQTEAAPRITTLAHEDFPAAPASVGSALPGGTLLIENEDGRPLGVGEQGNVVYLGPNVMLGYATTRADLAAGDVNCGRLDTGDIGMLDDAGRLTLTGRAKRQAKIFGLRVNMDELERIAGEVATVAVVQKGEALAVYYNPDAEQDLVPALLSRMLEHATLPRTAFRFLPLDVLPKTVRGKTDYKALEALS